MNPKCPSSKPNSPKRFSKILKIFTTEFQFLAIVKNHKIHKKQMPKFKKKGYKSKASKQKAHKRKPHTQD